MKQSAAEDCEAVGSSRRDGSRPRRRSGDLPRGFWDPVTKPYAPLELLSADHIETIHGATLSIVGESR